MLSAGSALGVTVFIAFLMMNGVIEVKKSRKEIRQVFTPVITALFLVFISGVLYELLTL
jgi:hypothetical protein